MTTRDLFADHAPADDRRIALGEAAAVLRGFALAEATALLAAIDDIARQAPFRHMVTPGGFEMSVALTNCGALGWTSDRRGYRYAARDPQTGQPWPPLPDCFLRLARDAAAAAGFPGFTPDACLINRYVPGARLSLHQDKDEQDYGAPIVSVSLGMPAMFLWGGHRRTDKTLRVPLFHGDVVVWGGPDRLRYHGVLPLKEAAHPLLGAQRINLTLRRAG
ncbi:DNA oxidative demethylase AlkB [Ralstonia sp. SM1864_UCD524_TZ4]|uniref:Alpha-ketoglutarate-dependent dioxygenase AlkB n=4 Tax=Ralstonia solanacearum species complex TaxID=3116862 RepID=A0A0S4UNT4_RALSL|nr:DNA oxidative demethylase AlkB [Ralstonia pseudosolanacearum]CUV23875.1 oxidative demethylase of N1-methyladenine or N3-methylcytosine DNA lesions [Ralstonia solanacearum]CUV33420.1 oxidative demethylase of N1-methyladenine or N3-methylcytosine DNA lesions [Ralstonia solanacearum]CUV39895.1 oxidative demethylase of N1-methyladenine or N3-methylcytosine DNA lesions [Ralstonia solanacearum]CUV61245.1 oxidative demethylase of N1-methyladenine or N3-methylcytosine DNA lesions [Ralstonia solanace